MEKEGPFTDQQGNREERKVGWGEDSLGPDPTHQGCQGRWLFTPKGGRGAGAPEKPAGPTISPECRADPLPSAWEAVEGRPAPKGLSSQSRDSFGSHGRLRAQG